HAPEDDAERLGVVRQAHDYFEVEIAQLICRHDPHLLISSQRVRRFLLSSTILRYESTTRAVRSPPTRNAALWPCRSSPTIPVKTTCRPSTLRSMNCVFSANQP